MKLIKVIMRPEKTYELKDILTGIGYHGITAKPCSGFGESKKVIKQIYRRKVYEQRIDSVKREKLEFVVPDDNVEKDIETIKNVDSTEHGADGRIYVSALEESAHIHSGDRHMGDASEKDLKDEL